MDHKFPSELLGVGTETREGGAGGGEHMSGRERKMSVSAGGREGRKLSVGRQLQRWGTSHFVWTVAESKQSTCDGKAFLWDVKQRFVHGACQKHEAQGYEYKKTTSRSKCET
jgi:hypothetical protein